MRYLSCDPRAEILGTNVLACLSYLQEYHVAELVRKYDLSGISPTDWVPTQRFLNILNDLRDERSMSSFMSVLVTVGMGIGGAVRVPVEDPCLSDVLTTWNEVYQGLHRNADVGAITCEALEATHYRMTFTDLYPDDVSYGILYGYAKRFLPMGTQFTIYYDPKVTPRDRGGDSGRTVIHIKWH